MEGAGIKIKFTCIILSLKKKKKSDKKIDASSEKEGREGFVIRFSEKYVLKEILVTNLSNYTKESKEKDFFFTIVHHNRKIYCNENEKKKKKKKISRTFSFLKYYNFKL